MKRLWSYRKTSIKRLAPIKLGSRVDAGGFGEYVSLKAGSLLYAGGLKQKFGGSENLVLAN